MEESPYAANYHYALSYLKLDRKDAAIEALKVALSQVPEDEKNGDNAVYLSILSSLAFLLLEKNDIESVIGYVNEGLGAKKDHADLLFMKALLLMDLQRFDEMLEALINYLMAFGGPDTGKFDYKYTAENTLSEIYNNLLPLACRSAFELEKIRDIVERLCKQTGNEWLIKGHEIMVKAAAVRSSKEV